MIEGTALRLLLAISATLIITSCKSEEKTASPAQPTQPKPAVAAAAKAPASAPVVAPAEAPAAVPKGPPPVRPLKPGRRKLDGLEAEFLANGGVAFRGTDVRGNKIDQNFESAAYFKAAIPVISQMVSPAQAAKLAQLGAELVEQHKRSSRVSSDLAPRH